MNRLTTICLAGALSAAAALLGGCSGGDESLTDAVAAITAPYAVLDLTTREFAMRLTVNGLASDPAYRDNLMVFRRVTVDGHDSFVAVFELTQAQWARLTSATPLPWSMVDSTVVPATSVAGDRPAFNLDYDTTATVVAAFHLVLGRLDLPSDAEWTAACGVSSGWSIGANPDQAQFTAAAVVRETLNGVDGPRQVGQRAENGRGFYDMHGNVWEWTRPGTVVRGGSWHDPAWSSRAEIAVGISQGIESNVPHALIGARLVLVQ